MLRLHPAIAPVKAAILPHGEEQRHGDSGSQAPRGFAEGQIVEYDDGGAIGRRYRRQDEIGTPFAFTIDEQTLEDDTVTVRDRDSLAQERLPLAGVPGWLDDALERAVAGRRRPERSGAQRPQPEAAVVLVRRGDDAQGVAQALSDSVAAYASANGAIGAPRCLRGLQG